MEDSKINGWFTHSFIIYINNYKGIDSVKDMGTLGHFEFSTTPFSQRSMLHSLWESWGMLEADSHLDAWPWGCPSSPPPWRHVTHQCAHWGPLFCFPSPTCHTPYNSLDEKTLGTWPLALPPSPNLPPGGNQALIHSWFYQLLLMKSSFVKPTCHIQTVGTQSPITSWPPSNLAVLTGGWQVYGLTFTPSSVSVPYRKIVLRGTYISFFYFSCNLGVKSGDSVFFASPYTFRPLLFTPHSGPWPHPQFEEEK